MKTETLREGADALVPMNGTDLAGVLLSLALWLVIIIAAPVIVLVLAVGLFSVELPLVLALGVILLVVRFTGLLPWEVVIVDQITGSEQRERYRFLWRAVRRIRDVNGDRAVKVRWAWA